MDILAQLNPPASDNATVSHVVQMLRTVTLPPPSTVDADKLLHCTQAIELLRITQPMMLKTYIPVHVEGDGNCLFRSVSMALYGNESQHLVLRALTAVEIFGNREWYDVAHPHSCYPLRNVCDMWHAEYNDVCRQVTTVDHSCDTIVALAVSAVIGMPIQTFWPPLDGKIGTSPMSQFLVGRDVLSTSKCVTIMWSTLGDVCDLGQLHIDHFVPLVKKPMSAQAVEQAFIIPDETEETVSASEAATERRDERRDDNVMFAGESGNMRFKPADEVHALLTQTESSAVLPHVPRGQKCNVCFVVDNARNVQRQDNSQKNQFWDDCGTWDSKNGRRVTQTYVKTENSLSVVKLVDGLYCRQRVVNKRRTWVPLQCQPSVDSVVTMESYYATLKLDMSFRKRVSWLTSHPHVALYEYQGTSPTSNEPHGLSRQVKSEYVRTKPAVLENIRTQLQTRRAEPHAVYQNLMLQDDSTERPRDHKQIRNQAQAACKDVGTKKGMNVADEITILLGKLQTHPFVKDVRMRPGRMPVVTAYTEEQVQDLKRFCSRGTPTSLRTVVGVDRTFNLGPCYVTVMVYKNLSVLRKTTRDHPVFLGPVMFHFDGRCDTYKTFFQNVSDALCGDVLLAEFGDVELVFGSDEEKAMVGAMTAAFPGTRHVFCARHIEENVRRFMTDVAGVPVRVRESVLSLVRSTLEMDVNDTADEEAKLTTLMAGVRTACASVADASPILTYISDRILPKVRNNYEVC